MKRIAWNVLTSHKTLKTLGWVVISGVLFLVSDLAAGTGLWEALVAVAIVLALKTPFYWAWEHAYDWMANLNHPKEVKCAGCRLPLLQRGKVD